ncbi:MAG TPA: DsrE/DsrF/DrsH-like family protein [Acidimicrobiia bacterium]|nr:DsrE/DsrF/DrsH-like family protein [Acidimicrobiia bacterium]
MTTTIDTALQEVLAPSEPTERPKRMALVASKGGLDEVYPVLILASTAAAIGWEVGVFCTFYGLDMVNKNRSKKLKVSAVGNAASPPPIKGMEFRVPTILGILPGMNSVATWMMKNWMKKSNIPSFEEMMQLCLESGVNFYACATTMGVMNVTKEDVIPEASCLGATAFLDFASGADVALFI